MEPNSGAKKMNSSTRGHMPRSNNVPVATKDPSEPHIGDDPAGTEYSDRAEKQTSFNDFGVQKQNIAVFAGLTNSSADSQEQKTPSLKDRAWRAKFFRIGPLSGIGCLVLTILSMLVSLGVLIGSNNVPIEDWTVQPSAILAICTAVANQSMRYAAFQGLMVAWWYGALRGSTIEKLHTDWRAGMTVAGALSAGRGMGVLGLACIFSTLVAIDGPLLQKASHVVYSPVEKTPIALNVSVLPELPSYMWVGYVRDSKPQSDLVFNSTAPTANNGSVPNDIGIEYDSWLDRIQGPWLRNEVISDAVLGCPADTKCKLNVRAPALAVTACTSYQIPVNYLDPAGAAEIDNLDHAPPLNRQGFFVDITLVAGNVAGNSKEKINVVTGYSRTEGCVGVLNYTACTLESAIADYEVTIAGEMLTLLNTKTPAIVALANNTGTNGTWNPNQGWHNSALGGVVAYITDKWEGSVVWTSVDGVTTKNSLGSENDLYKNYNHLGYLDGNLCVDYLDPLVDVLEDMNRLMFYTGYITGTHLIDKWKAKFVSQLDPGLEIDPTVTGHIYGHRDMYKTDLRWFGAAAAVEALCIALVLPTFIGWWRLGRHVSFSPLEIAKAFEAPLLSDCNSNSSGRDIAKSIGSVRIQYGSTMDYNTGSRKLAFADPMAVRRPQQGSYLEM